MGKTTLLASWASQHAKEVAWLALDELDNSPTSFWAAVIAALRTRVPGIGALALSMLHSPQPPPFSALLTALLNELAEMGESAGPLVLLLDDYQLIADPLIHEALAFWVKHQPTHVHLLLASRVDPDLPLSRWRARGYVLELRTDEVRFLPEEAALFLRQTMGLSLAEEEVAALMKRTEGWVAGLQLAALFLRRKPDPAAWIASFSGSHRYMLDYLQEEVLRHLPLSIQRFLWQVAVLTQMNAALCQAVTGEPASQELLETLERENLFVVPLDEQRRWYRLHDLFRESLLTLVQASQPDLLPHAHQRAARWYEAQAVLIWLDALPDAVLFSHARLALYAVRLWTESMLVLVEASYAPALALMEHVLERLETLVQHQTKLRHGSEAEEAIPVLPDAEVAVVQRRLRLLHALLTSRTMLLRDDAEGMRLLVEELVGLVSQEEVSWKIIGLLPTFWLTVTLQRGGGYSRCCWRRRPMMIRVLAQMALPLPIWFFRVIGTIEVVGALGLILPGLTRIKPWLTPLAAAGLALEMVGATIMTVIAQGVAPALFPLVVGLLAGFVCYGRGSQWRLV